MKKLEKSLKILWFINGIIIFFILCLAAYQLVDDIFPDHGNYPSDDLIVGEKLDEAKKQGLKLQGLSYSEPEEISHVDLLYMTVSIDTYKDPLSIKNSKIYSNYGMSLHPGYSGGYYESRYDKLNVIFMDKDYQVLRTLLDKKANIATIKFDRADTAVSKKQNEERRHIAYKIAFEDSNKDNFLNGDDYHDLYLSSINGTNLSQITKGIDVDKFTFAQQSTQLFITYYERNDKKQEHKRKKFALYDIASDELRLLADLDKTIDKLENQLTN